MSEIQETQKKTSLESRIKLMALSAFASGFVAAAALDQIDKENYGEATLLGVFEIINIAFAYAHGKKAIENYKQ